jgi:phage virion morphogenesis protein
MTGSIGLTVSLHGLLPLQQQLAVLALPPALRKKLLTKLSKEVQKASKKRVKRYTDLHGNAWKARKNRKVKRKMLKKLGGEITQTYQSADSVRIGFKSGARSKIAARHQFGAQLTPAEINARKNSDNGGSSGGAGRSQAKALLTAGYKARINGRYKTPSIKWITDNLSNNQAAFILFDILGVQRDRTISDHKLPARSFLGATDAEIKQHVTAIYQQITQQVLAWH